jgi:hypothetical protein
MYVAGFGRGSCLNGDGAPSVSITTNFVARTISKVIPRPNKALVIGATTINVDNDKYLALGLITKLHLAFDRSGSVKKVQRNIRKEVKADTFRMES